MADNIELNLGAGGETIATDDIGGIQHELVKIEFGADGVATMVDDVNPLPVTDGDATTLLSLLTTFDYATQTTLAGILTKLNASIAVTGTFFQVTQPVSGTVAVTGAGDATAANQATGNGTLASILAKIIAAPSTEAKQDTLIAKDFATQATLAAVLAKIITSPATEATLAAIQALMAKATVVLNGVATIVTAGTRITLAASTVCQSVTIKASIDNTGIVYVGDASVSSANGFRLNPGDPVSMDITNLNTVNLDASVSGSVVSYIAIQ